MVPHDTHNMLCHVEQHGQGTVVVSFLFKFPEELGRCKEGYPGGEGGACDVGQLMPPHSLQKRVGGWLGGMLARVSGPWTLDRSVKRDKQWGQPARTVYSRQTAGSCRSGRLEPFHSPFPSLTERPYQVIAVVLNQGKMNQKFAL